MAIECIGSIDHKKLKELFDVSDKFYQDIEHLQGSLKDAIDAKAEEFGIKANVLRKATKLHYKGTFDKEKESVDEVASILDLIEK